MGFETNEDTAPGGQSVLPTVAAEKQQLGALVLEGRDFAAFTPSANVCLLAGTGDRASVVN